MDIKDIVVYLIAIYGALLSTYSAILATIIGVRELQKGRRRIKIFLEYVDFAEIVQVVIVNIGHRPITISNMGLKYGIKQEKGWSWEDVPSSLLFANDPENPQRDIAVFPIKLEDGESLTIPLSDVVSQELGENGLVAKLRVYDAEGRIYTEYDKKHYDLKFGTYYPQN